MSSEQPEPLRARLLGVLKVAAYALGILYVISLCSLDNDTPDWELAIHGLVLGSVLVFAAVASLFAWLRRRNRPRGPWSR